MHLFKQGLAKKLGSVLLALSMTTTIGLGLFSFNANEANAAETKTSSVSKQGVEDFKFNEYNVNYEIHKDKDGGSSVSVEETFVAEFPEYNQNKGIIRTIPLTYDGLKSEIEFFTVVDENNIDVPYVYYEENDNAVIEVGDDSYLQGVNTFVIKYVINDAVRFFSETNTEEFYWNTNGNNWAQPFAEANVTVKVDADVSGTLTGETACYRGAYGFNTPCNIVSEEDGSFQVTETDLKPRENITIAIGFEKGTFNTPVDSTPLMVGLLALIFAITSGIAVWLLNLQRKLGKTGVSPSQTVIAAYTAPDEEDLFALSQVLQTRASESKVKSNVSPVPATIIKLAINRNINIIQTSKTEYGYEVLNKDGLTDSELMFLQAMENNAPKDTSGNILFTGHSQALASAISGIAGQYPESVKRSGYTTTAPRLSRKVVLFSIAALILMVPAGILINFVGESSLGVMMPMLTLVALMFPAIAIAVGLIPPDDILTAKGAALKEQVQGVQLYIKVAEEARIDFLQSVKGAERVKNGKKTEIVKLYEKLLPIAMLLGLEKSWVTTLSSIYEEQGVEPIWANNIPLYALNSFVGNVSTSVSSSTTPPPSSNGIGGTGGGGFSGGGGGGGGGGGR